MAKESKMVEEAKAQTKVERPYITDAGSWEKSSGPEFGGQADILSIQVGEVAGPFEYMGHQPMILEGNKQITVHLGATDDGETLRLPIAASFLRAIDQAEIMKGDKFLIRRFDDVKKKAGVGKGQSMNIFAIKVLVRTPRQAPVTPGQAV